MASLKTKQLFEYFCELLNFDKLLKVYQQQLKDPDISKQ